MICSSERNQIFFYTVVGIPGDPGGFRGPAGSLWVVRGSRVIWPFLAQKWSDFCNF